MCLCWNRRCEATFPYWDFARVWKNDDTHARYRGMGGEHPGERVKMILRVTEFRTGSLEHRSWNVEFGASGFEVGVWSLELGTGSLGRNSCHLGDHHATLHFERIFLLHK